MDERDLLAADVIDELTRQGVTGARYLPDQFAVEVRTPERSGLIYLTNVLNAVRANPENRAGRVAQCVTSFRASDDAAPAWEQARDQLRPVLRHATFGQDIAEAPMGLLRRPSLPFLAEYVVVDRPDAMRYVVAGDPAKDWSVGDDEVFLAARQGVAGVPLVPTPAEQFYLSDTGDQYVVSHLFVDGWLAGLADTVGGRPVAFAPDTNTLLVGRDGPALAELFDLAEQVYRRGVKSLSPAAYTVDEAGRVVPYRAPAGSPLAPLARRAECLLALDVYGQQKRLIDEEEEIQIVAEFNAAQRPDGGYQTYAPWVARAGMPTLLPEVDFVVVVDTDGTSAGVPFDALIATGLVEEAAQWYPNRYRTDPDPSADALERVRARAITP